MNNPKIFVYGSLREGFFNYEKYLKGKVEKKEAAKVKGKVFHMPYKGYPAIFDGNGYVEGEVMKIKNDCYDRTIEALDEMEGFFGENNPKNEYHKKLVEVELETGSKELCYVYYYNKNNDSKFDENAVYVSSGDWKKFMIN